MIIFGLVLDMSSIEFKDTRSHVTYTVYNQSYLNYIFSRGKRISVIYVINLLPFGQIADLIQCEQHHGIHKVNGRVIYMKCARVCRKTKIQV